MVTYLRFPIKNKYFVPQNSKFLFFKKISASKIQNIEVIQKRKICYKAAYKQHT